MASSGDQLFAHGITFDAAPSVGGVGEYRLETDGTNMYFNGTLLTRAADSVTDFTVSNTIYTSNILYINSPDVGIRFTDANVSVTSNLILKTVLSLPGSGSGLLNYNGDLYYNGNQVGASTNAFDVVTADLVTPRNVLTSDDTIHLSGNVQLGDVVWANTANLTTTTDFKFNKSDPTIYHESGCLSLESVSGECSLRIRSQDRSNVMVIAKSSTDAEDENESRVGFFGTVGSEETLLTQIYAAQKEALGTTGGGGKMVFQGRDPNVNTDTDTMLDVAGYFTSTSSGNVFAVGPGGDSDKVHMTVGTGWSPTHRFEVGTGSGVNFGVSTTNSKVHIGSGNDLTFDGSLVIRQSDNKIQIGTSKTAGDKSILIGQGAGTTASKSTVSIGVSAGQAGQASNTLAVGFEAGQTNQGLQAAALGYQAGKTTQGDYGVTVGTKAGQTTQGEHAIAVGYQAGNSTQGSHSVAVGSSAGLTSQQTGAVAVGYKCGLTNQTAYSVAVGYLAGESNQTDESVAIGKYSGRTTQGSHATAIGSFAGNSLQGDNAIAIGYGAGESNQGADAISFGEYSGNDTQGSNALAIGVHSGVTSQGASAIAIGPYAGETYQNTTSIAIGFRAGKDSQGPNSISMGYNACVFEQHANSVAIGHESGFNVQGSQAIAVGSFAGRENQNAYATAIGFEAGRYLQGFYSVGVGWKAGRSNQQNYATAIGALAGTTSQSSFTVAAGNEAGESGQGIGAIAIGRQAGETNQGSYSIAIGHRAGQSTCHDNAIILNASTSDLSSGLASAFYVNPIRYTSTVTSNVTSYNTTTKEVVNSGAITIANQNVGIGTASPSSTLTVNGSIEASDLVVSPGVTSLTNMSSTTLSINMDGKTYKTFSVNTNGNDINDLNITNAIAGCQGIVFITATTTDSTIASPFSTSATYKSANLPVDITSGDVAVMAFTYNGSKFFCTSSNYS